jgi:hypothetical protein
MATLGEVLKGMLNVYSKIRQAGLSLLFMHSGFSAGIAGPLGYFAGN